MKKLELLDYCLNDYFTGYHLPVLQVPVYSTMTNEEIAKELQSEFNYSYGLFESVPDFENMLNSYCNELLENPSEIFVECEENTEEEDFYECAYLFFSITDKKQVNEITFLS